MSNTRSSETISRTSSASSLDFPNTPLSAVEPRRTRKRITPCQLEQLEELYRQSSHPTREQRDALGRRIQMETKSVTIWFQNKRQTDRKVALHKATYSQAIERSKVTEESIPTSFEIPGNPMKRTSSYASSVSSTSSTSSKSKRPSLDRVASRSEIRFIDKRVHVNEDVAKRENLVFKHIISTSSSSHRAHASPLMSPVSPVRTSSALWSHMLSSPIAPSSPPPAELVAYSRTRKTRTLDWACTVARLSTKEEDFSKVSLDSSLEPAFGALKQDAVMSEREYEDAISTTEDEAELVDSHLQASQPAPVLWGHGDKRQVTVTNADHCAEGGTHSMGSNSVEKSVKKHPWQEDEMHAALALCGLRG
ncbi:hypothetical protein Clacol_007349 [Clathrus columnatus]|uniref:Homeobox domain-containing protein n=1 Tax=Clathrus columnatus TaxID=1419009 RepID=A0AAV5AIZ4_9AGAM|nr:hypothetical protein Clacol_007349 [Clathrus columnatus]